MTKPSYLKGRKPVRVPLHSMADILGSIDKLGHSEPFKAAAQKSGAYVTVHPKTVNFVKDYMAQNNLHAQSDVAKNVVNACPQGQQPEQCPYTQDD